MTAEKTASGEVGGSSGEQVEMRVNGVRDDGTTPKDGADATDDDDSNSMEDQPLDGEEASDADKQSGAYMAADTAADETSGVDPAPPTPPPETTDTTNNNEGA